MNLHSIPAIYRDQTDVEKKKVKVKSAIHLNLKILAAIPQKKSMTNDAGQVFKMKSSTWLIQVVTFRD